MRTEDALIFYHAGVLDPAEAMALEARLAASPALREALAELRRRWSPEQPVTTPAWRIPPPGLGVGARAGLPAVFAEGTLRAGDRFHVRIDPLPQPETRQVVVLRREGRSWAVAFPTRADQQLNLVQLDRDDDGSYRLDLTVRGPPGRQRWAVALPDRADPVNWDADDATRWAALREAVASGRVPVASVEITVSE